MPNEHILQTRIRGLKNKLTKEKELYIKLSARQQDPMVKAHSTARISEIAEGIARCEHAEVVIADLLTLMNRLGIEGNNGRTPG